MNINNKTYYIIRCNGSGVFAGNIKKQNGQEVTITNARCLWRWYGAATLMQMAVDGVSEPNKCRFTVTVPEITMLDAIEILPCSKKAERIIRGVEEWKL